MVKSIFVGTLSLAILFVALAGCTIAPGLRTIRGKGDIVSKDFKVGAIHEVDITGNLELVYTDAVSDVVTLEMHENLFDHIKVEERNGVLHIEPKSTFLYTDNNLGKVHVSTETLEKVTMAGVIIFQDADIISGDSFEMKVQGACSTNIALDVKALTISSAGAGEIQLSGVAQQSNLELAGVGSVKAENLQTNDSKVTISGAGDVNISCSDTLQVTMNGAGSLRYKGSPHVTQNIAGVGSVQQIK